MGQGESRSLIVALFLLLASGCRVPPAHPAGCAGSPLPRSVQLVRQVAADTAVGGVCCPVHSAQVLATEPVAYFRAWGAGIAQKRVAMHLMAAPPPLCAVRPTLDPAELEAQSLRLSGQPLSPADVRLFLDGGAALAALERLIDCASCRIDVLMYLWGSDEIGWRIARRLAARAAAGLPVRVLVDGAGNLAQGEPRSASTAEVNAAVCWLARQPNVHLLRTRDPLLRIDHRKLVIADGQAAWSGGRNFYRAAFETDHDLTYTVAGPLAGQLAEGFEGFWREQGGQPGQPLAPPALPPAPNALARVTYTRPLERQLSRLLYEAVERAQNHVYVENPFFSDSHLLYQLARARQRGADVRVVLTLQSGSSLYNRANRVTANRLLQAGVRVYLYPGVTHVKALAVDGLWAYAGTGNFDPLSLRHNREVGLAISAGPALAEIEGRLFLPDFNPDWELTAPLPVTALDVLSELLAAAAA